ncbi:MAG: ExbD/TolR family protein [Opitutales bacterium]
MKVWTPEDVDDRPDLTPMIDVVFLLIVFFMTVATLLTAEKIEIEMPVATASQVPEDTTGRETITLLPGGELFAGIRPVEEADLREIVSQGLAEQPGYKVYLRVDQNTPHKHVRELMKLCAEAGAYDVIFAVFQNEQ